MIKTPYIPYALQRVLGKGLEGIVLLLCMKTSAGAGTLPAHMEVIKSHLNLLNTPAVFIPIFRILSLPSKTYMGFKPSLKVGCTSGLRSTAANLHRLLSTRKEEEDGMRWLILELMPSKAGNHFYGPRVFKAHSALAELPNDSSCLACTRPWIPSSTPTT